jgi:hypothetical protein
MEGLIGAEVKGWHHNNKIEHTYNLPSDQGGLGHLEHSSHVLAIPQLC